MTFGEMKERVRLTLGMSETISNDEAVLIKAWINEGVTDLISRTRAYSRVINLTVQPHTAVHDMAGIIIALVDIELPGRGFLRRYSRQDIADAQGSTGWYGHDSQYNEVGNGLGFGYGYAYEEPLFWFSPIPSEPLVIRAYGVFRPQEMSDDSHDLTNPNYGGLAEEFHTAVLNYVLWKAGEYVQHQGSGEGEKWRLQYEGADGMGGDIARVKRTLLKRVTPQAAQRRNLARTLGVLSPSGDYIGAR
jgi:hypothetical protein